MSARQRRSSGVTLTEFLVAASILAILVGLVAPLVTERVRMAKVRTMAGQFANDLRAARWIAVSNRGTVNLVVDVNAESYQYTDAHGKIRRVQMPDGVDIVSSTSPIQFRSNGSVLGGAATVIQVTLDGEGNQASKWTVTTSTLGIPSTVHEKI